MAAGAPFPERPAILQVHQLAFHRHCGHTFDHLVAGAVFFHVQIHHRIGAEDLAQLADGRLLDIVPVGQPVLAEHLIHQRHRKDIIATLSQWNRGLRQHTALSANVR